MSSVRIKDVKKQIQANYEATIGRCNKIKTDVDDAEESMRANVQKVASDWYVYSIILHLRQHRS